MTHIATLDDVAVPGRAAAARASRGALLFTGGIFASSLLVQRFGVLSGTSYLDAVTPVGMSLAALFVLTGTLVFNRARLMIYCAICAMAFVGAAAGALVPNDYGGVPSIFSLIQFLLLSSFATLTFARPVDEKAFFRVVNGCISIVSIAGLIEFFLQFGHIELFTFKDFLPQSILVEPFWNVVIPVEGTPLFKSNGFFLLEPSLFSQYMAIGLLIEILVLRRVRYLCLFGAGLVSSVSGTGWLMIIGFALTAVVSLGGRGIILGIATAAVGAAALGALALFSSDVYHFLIARTDEFTTPGSSGHLRFVTPWWLASDMINESPRILLFGLGAGVSEHPGRTMPYEFNVNSIVKLLLEFGAPALTAFLSLFFVGRRTHAQNALIAPIMVWLLWDGSNVEIPFVLMPCMLLLLTADLRPAAK